MAKIKNKDKKCCCIAHAHSLKSAIKKLGKKGKDGAHKKVKQLNDRTVWKPVHPNDLTTDEKKKR